LENHDDHVVHYRDDLISSDRNILLTNRMENNDRDLANYRYKCNRCVEVKHWVYDFDSNDVPHDIPDPSESIK
jgi:hypothetical protein